MADKDKDPTVSLPKLKEPAHIPVSREPGKMHVDLYLQGKSVKLWERGGKKAYALAKGKEFASEKDFDEIFKKY